MADLERVASDLQAQLDQGLDSMEQAANALDDDMDVLSRRVASLSGSIGGRTSQARRRSRARDALPYDARLLLDDEAEEGSTDEEEA